MRRLLWRAVVFDPVQRPGGRPRRCRRRRFVARGSPGFDASSGQAVRRIRCCQPWRHRSGHGIRASVVSAAAHPRRRDERSRELRTGAAVRIDWAHDSDRVSVWVLDYGVAGSPERVVRRLLPDISEGRQLGVEPVDSFSASDPEPDDSTARMPSAVPAPGELGAVEVEVDTAWQAGASVMGLKCGIGVWDVQSKPAVEGHGGLHVGNDEVQLVKDRAVVHSTLVPLRTEPWLS